MAQKRPPVVPAQKRNAGSFLGAYDDSVAIPAALKAALAALRKIGVEEWRYETEFCTFAKVGTNKIGPFRDYFAAHIVQVPARDRGVRNVWFADKAVAEKMRKALAKNVI